MRRMRAYLRFDRRESRLPAAIAILVVAVLYPLIPSPTRSVSSIPGSARWHSRCSA